MRLLRVTAWLHEETGDDELVFAGGTALSCSANGRILRESAFRDLFIPPSAHDGGAAVGCALYGMIECLGERSDFRWTDDFLGPEPGAAALDTAVRSAAARTYLPGHRRGSWSATPGGIGPGRIPREGVAAVSTTRHDGEVQAA